MQLYILQPNPFAKCSLFFPLLPQPNLSPQSDPSRCVSRVISLAKGKEDSQTTGLNLGDKTETDVSEESTVCVFTEGMETAGSSDMLAWSTYQPNDIPVDDLGKPKPLFYETKRFRFHYCD
jgi:hypothetical protein